jgi:hypothetical protein
VSRVAEAVDREMVGWSRERPAPEENGRPRFERPGGHKGDLPMSRLRSDRDRLSLAARSLPAQVTLTVNQHFSDKPRMFPATPGRDGNNAPGQSPACVFYSPASSGSHGRSRAGGASAPLVPASRCWR